MNKSDTRKHYNSYFVMYTILFAALSILFFYGFWKAKLSFVWNVDGRTQHIHALQFYSDWLQQIAKNILFKHKLEIPLWSFSIGYGSDIITTLHYYVIGDPLCLLSIFVPDRYMVHFYDIMILFRVYLAGLSFSVYCFYRKQNNRIAVITGALLYAFSMYILVMGFHHPFFINPLIYFPLLLIGIERILEEKSPIFFILMVFICTISNFYFMYMIALNAAIYLFIRLFSIYGVKNIRILLKKLGCMIIGAIVGVMMGACILLPVISLFMENSRDGSGQRFQLLYEEEFYKKLPEVFITGTQGMHHTMLGICGIVLFSVCLLFMKRKENAELKINFIILTIFLFTPIAGKIFNGFAYPSNRWMFSYVLLLSYIVVVMWDELSHMSWKSFIGTCIVSVVICTYNFYNFSADFEGELREYIYLLCVGLIILAIGNILLKNRLKKYRGFSYIMQISMFILAIITVQLNVKKVFHNTDLANTEFVEMEKARKDLKSSADKAIEKATVDDKDFFRYDAKAELIERNSTLQSSLHSTNFYWSLTGKLPSQLFEETGLTNKGAYNYKNLDGRTTLNALAATKYYVTKTEKNGKYSVPFGYKKIANYNIKMTNKIKKCTVFKNEYALPLGYTYDSYYTRTDYEQMNEMERQNALLQGILLEKEQKGYSKAGLKKHSGNVCSKTDIKQTYSEIPYKIVQHNNVDKKANIFKVKSDDASIVLETSKAITNSEVSLFIGDISGPKANRVADDDSIGSKYTVIVENSTGEKNKKQFFYFQPGNIYYAGRNHFLINLSYYKKGKQTITLKFPQKGNYKIEDLKVYAQPIDQYSQQISALKENVLKNIKMDTNTIQGNINLKKDKILCLAVPYSKGWKATVDGKEQELLQANTMYMALPLSEGNHSVILKYGTPGLKAGIAISFAGLILCIIIKLLLHSFLLELKHRKKK